MSKHHRIVGISGLIPVVLFLSIATMNLAAEKEKRILVWNTKALFMEPAIHETNERPARRMRSFFYEGAEYKGKPTKVFAYYATPQGKSPEGGWPAVVCAHGGGGRLFLHGWLIGIKKGMRP